MRTVTKAELKRERKGVCDDGGWGGGGGSLLAEPKDSCGARRDMKGLLASPGGCAGWSGRQWDDSVRQIGAHPGGGARPRRNGGVITNVSGLQLIQASDR